MRKWCLIILAVLLLAGCGVETQDEERLQDLDFTVMDLEKQRLQHFCQGSVSDKKRDLCGYRTGGSRKPGTDGRSGDLPLYSTEIRVS